MDPESVILGKVSQMEKEKHLMNGLTKSEIFTMNTKQERDSSFGDNLACCRRTGRDSDLGWTLHTPIKMHA